MLPARARALLATPLTPPPLIKPSNNKKQLDCGTITCGYCNADEVCDADNQCVPKPPEPCQPKARCDTRIVCGFQVRDVFLLVFACVSVPSVFLFNQEACVLCVLASTLPSPARHKNNNRATAAAACLHAARRHLPARARRACRTAPPACARPTSSNASTASPSASPRRSAAPGE